MALTRLDTAIRLPFANGQTFGAVGAYERIDGFAHFAVDPEHPDNAVIADIALAPRNFSGLVEFSANFRHPQARGQRPRQRPAAAGRPQPGTGTGPQKPQQRPPIRPPKPSLIPATAT